MVLGANVVHEAEAPRAPERTYEVKMPADDTECEFCEENRLCNEEDREYCDLCLKGLIVDKLALIVKCLDAMPKSEYM